MKHQVLFPSKDKSKKIKCRLLQFLSVALRFRFFFFSQNVFGEVKHFYIFVCYYYYY